MFAEKPTTTTNKQLKQKQKVLSIWQTINILLLQLGGNNGLLNDVTFLHVSSCQCVMALRSPRY